MYRFINMRTTLAVLAALLVATGLQAQSTTGRLIGKVVDEQGGALPGVTVTIASEVLIGGAQTKIADINGEFSFIGVAPGNYTLQVVLSGFVSQERSEIKVPLGGAASIIIEMPEGTFGGEIEVMAETPVIDPTQVNTEQVFDQAYLQGAAIGSNNRSYQSVLIQAPGVTGGSNPNVFGSNIGENAYFVDGVNTTDPVSSTFGTNFNFDAIQEIQFQTSGFEAEYGNATGGIVNLVTKSGGNQFSGTADVRYRDDSFQESGDHFDTSELDTQRQEVNLTLGGPIVRDALWFFVSYQHVDSDFTPIGSPSTRTFTGNYPLAKLTWQAGPSWRVIGKYSSDPADIDNWNAAFNVTADAGAFQEQGAEIFSAELNGVLSESLLWNSTVGIYRSDLNSFPQMGDLEPISHFNFATGISSVNFPNQQYSKRDRDDFNTNLTWFVDDLGGSHEFKGGIEYSDLSFSSSNCSTGTVGGVQCIGGDNPGHRYQDILVGGVDSPWIFWEDFNTGTQDFTGVNATVFAQDSWRVAPDLTVKIGVRYDDVSYDTNGGVEIADINKWQPRLGFAWDLTGDAKNLVRGNFGTFMSPNALTLPSFARTDNAPGNRWLSCSNVLPLFGHTPGSAQDCEDVVTGEGWQYRATDPDNLDPFGWFLRPSDVFGGEPNLIDPNLKAMYTETWSLAYERAVGNRASIELTYVDKTTKDNFEDTCDDNFPGPPTPDARCSFYVMTNLPGLRSDYQGFIVKYETRAFSWLTLLASYTYSKSEGDIEYNQNAGSDFDVYPAHFENRFGYLLDDRRHRVKLNGFFSIKGDWTIGFDGFWSSAFRWEPLANPGDNGGEYNGQTIPAIPYGFWFAESRGSRKANGNYQLDLQLSKGFAIGSTRLVLIGSVFNAFSNEKVTGVCSHISGLDEDGFVTGGCFNAAYNSDLGPVVGVNDPLVGSGGATNWQTPRRYEVGLRLEF